VIPVGNYNVPVQTDFENGMQLITIANEFAAASQIAFTVGTRNDPLMALVGMAHLSEHIFCRGASPEAITAVARRNATARPGTERPIPVSERAMNRMCRKFLGSSNGPGINVYTLTSHTGYGHQDLFHPRYLKNVFSVMAGVVRDCMYGIRDMRNRHDAIISPQAFSVERAAVDNETAGNDEHPGMAGYRAALQVLYRANPARHFGDSDPAQLAKIKLGTMKQWGQGQYVPANMRIVIIGPSRNAAVRLVRDAGLADLPAWPATPWTYDHSDDVPVLTDVRRIELARRDIAMRHVCMLWPTETYTSADALTLLVLAGLLKDRIEYELRERNTVFPGGVYHPSVDWDATSSHGFLAVRFCTKGNDAHCQDLIQRTLESIEAIKIDRSAEFVEDVEDGRFYQANDYLEEYKFTPGAFADRIVAALANGDVTLKRFNTFYRDMLHISPAQVRNAAIKYLHGDRFVLSVVRPAS
jgi:predicted Zn-dependent peptidase